MSEPSLQQLNARYAAQLNESQLDAVTYCDGPSLVIAGAGSGKTRVLTYKIAYLLERGLAPWNILALTFTNKAAREMNSRIADICAGRDIRGLWSGTFHSLFARLLRMEHHLADLPADFSIYDATDSKSLIKSIVKELELDDKKYKPSTIAGRISEAKNHIILPDAYCRDQSIARRDYTDGIGETGKIYTLYQDRLFKAGALDFDDLLLRTYLLLHNNADVRTRYQQRFQYILVDEYQDTNMLQHRILAELTTPTSRICVVGDDAQSIYGFRGADINNILQFTQQYPSARLIKLECNYRSTQTIVEAANSIIRHNRGQIPKKVFSAGDKGEPIRLFSAYSDKEEAAKITAHLSRLYRREHIDWNEMALLYRTNAQSRSLEEALKQANIPYRIYGGLSFYQRKEIKDVLAYCRLTANLDDEEAFKRIVNYPTRGIGATTINKLQVAAATAGVSLWTAVTEPERCGLTLGGAARNKLTDFCRLILAFREAMTTMGAYDLTAEIVRKSGIGADINKERSQEALTRQQNVEELLSSIRSAETDALEEEGKALLTLPEFLSTVSLLTDTEEQDDDTPRVTLMTVHAAKGLEFEVVFVTGMEDDLFPGQNARLYPKEMEEERRLFYVAVTRAKHFCYLTYAKSRWHYGSMEFSMPSPFLQEIDDQYVEDLDNPLKGGASKRIASTERPNTSPYQQKIDSLRSGAYQPRAAAPSPQRIAPTPSPSFRPASAPPPASATAARAAAPSGGTLTIGTRILHERFGQGTVVGLEGTGEGQKVRVDFDSVGPKNLLVKFAKFRVL